MHCHTHGVHMHLHEPCTRPPWKNSYILRNMDCIIFNLQILGDFKSSLCYSKCVFLGSDSLDLMGRKTESEGRQKRLLGAEQPRLLTDYILLFLHCNHLKTMTLLDPFSKKENIREAQKS